MGMIPDQIDVTSKSLAFINREIITATKTYSGTIPDGGESQTLTLETARNFGSYEAYAKKSGAFNTVRLDNMQVLLDMTWDHNVYISVSQVDGEDLEIDVFIDNPSGGSKVLTSQTFTYTVYVFDTPFSTI